MGCTMVVRSISSKEWLHRHQRDPYVKLAEKGDLRSRSAFKLIELQDRFRFINPTSFVVDLGSSPGGWSLAAAKLLGPTGLLVSVDLLAMEPVRVGGSGGAAVDAHFYQGDFTSSATQEHVVQTGLSRRRASADVVLSDMLQNTSGRHDLDHFRSMDLCHEALAFCDKLLRPGGTFVAKYLRGQVGVHGRVHNALQFTDKHTCPAGGSGAFGGREAGVWQRAQRQAQGVAARILRDVPRRAEEARGGGCSCGHA